MKTQSPKSKHNPDCPCTWPDCDRHGNCEECRKYHHASGEKTSCERLRK
jgi:hypothetical protein